MPDGDNLGNAARYNGVRCFGRAPRPPAPGTKICSQSLPRLVAVRSYSKECCHWPQDEFLLLPTTALVRDRACSDPNSYYSFIPKLRRPTRFYMSKARSSRYRVGSVRGDRACLLQLQYIAMCRALWRRVLAMCALHCKHQCHVFATVVRAAMSSLYSSKHSC